MWRSLMDWYDEFEREQLAVLVDPAMATRARPGYRRWNASKLAAMSPVERSRLHEFCVTYRGARLWKALAKWAAAFTLTGLLLHLVFDSPGWLGAVLLINLAGFVLLLSGVSIWFNPNEIFKSKRKVLAGAIGGALLGALGSFVGLMLAHGEPTAAIFPRLQQLALGAIVAALVLFVPMYLASAFRRSQYLRQAAELQRDAERERLAREVSEAQLRMLRAQIEPHFLFNTLGAVQQLAADGAPRAAALTADLIAFLRASFSDMRCEQVSLATEFATTASYLRVMQARMGARLRFDLFLPDALKAVEVPSMIVLTLVENAIKHGIEPSLRGGEIRVTAQDGDGCVTVRVHDTGVGVGVGMGAAAAMAATAPGGGAGLDNVRSRLRLAYGDGAGLVLRDADPGLTAELRIPATMKETA